MEENVPENPSTEDKKHIRGKKKDLKSKEQKSGIIYLSRIPTGMNATILRQQFDRFGETGRLYLQQHQHGSAPIKKHKKRKLFSEGWVEFHRKKVAKKVALCLNNAPIGGKKKNPWCEELWNIKYLPRFKWSHLHERLVYERTVRSQRLRTEITQAKKEANFYIENAEKNEKIQRIAKKKLKQLQQDKGAKEANLDNSESTSDRVYEFHQKPTEEEIIQQKAKKRKFGDNIDKTKKKKLKKQEDVISQEPETRKSFLSAIFSGGFDSD